MNTIYNKLKPNRKYTRKPKCANWNGFCTWDKCRCNYAVKVPKGDITKVNMEEVIHRGKVVDRRREIELQKLDNENGEVICWDLNRVNYKSRFSEEKENRKKYKRMILKAFGIIVLILILYILIINLFNI